MSLQIAGLTVCFPDASAPAVDQASLTVGTGDVVAVLGPSGCGKSSLLRAVAGVEPVASGTVSWDGADLERVPVHRRGFGLMFQEGQLFPLRDVGGNVEFGLQMARIDAPQRRERVRELLELVGLAGFETRPIATLSGGEQQRVALARALAPRPRLLLLDEPLSALDRGLREHLAGELAQILRRAKTTALYVTHDHDEAFTVADEIALMRSGRIVQIGTAAQLWDAPVDAEAAAFLGYRVVADGDRWLGLGPGALSVLAGDEAAAWSVSGEVTATGFARGEFRVVVTVPTWGQVSALAGANVAVGDRVRLRVDPAATRTGEGL